MALVGEGLWSCCSGSPWTGSTWSSGSVRTATTSRRTAGAATFNLRDVPVPHVFAIGEALGGAFAITERAVGRRLGDLDAAGWRAAIPLLFAALDDIRSLDVSDQPGHGEWDGTGAAKQRSWRDHLLTRGDRHHRRAPPRLAPAAPRRARAATPSSAPAVEELSHLRLRLPRRAVAGARAA